MEVFNDLLQKAARRKPLRYLIVGVVNTVFGYVATVALYYALTKWLHLVVIVVVANVICITFSFVTYKFFVFRSGNNWLHEYLRCYLVYGGSALMGIVGLWLLVNGLAIPFWIAQAVLMVVTVIISYVGHDRFTFARKG